MTIEAKGSGAAAGRRIRLGMVGGGEGAFIGGVHRIAARLDDQYELVAGALASTPEKARRSGLALGLAADRCYADYAAMAKAEGKRADGVEAVAIVTPNHLHAPVAEAFLAAGIHVVEHLTNLGELPPSGARFTAAPPAVEGFGTFPVRAFATLG